jgi:DNA gyrase subunit A
MEDGREDRGDARGEGIPEDKYVVMGTLKGVVKKTSLDAFSNPRAGGIIAMGVEEGDAVIAVQSPTAAARSSSARATAWRSASRRPTSGRWAAPPTASAASRLRDDDYVVAMEVVKPGGTLLTVTERGFGKRTESTSTA